MFWKQLFPLIWKFYVIRRRRYFHTTIEFAAPTFLFIMLLFFSSINQTNLNQEVVPVAYPLDRTSKVTRLIYSPENPNANAIMEDVAKTLKLRRITQDPNTAQSGYSVMRDANQTSNFVKNMKPLDAIVLFNNLDQEDLPSKLNYTIRMKRPFQTNMYKPLDHRLGPHESFASIYEPFLNLQWAIDKAYLKMQTGTAITQTLTLQEFPYIVSNEAKNREEISNLSLLMEAICWMSLTMPFVFIASRLLEERLTGMEEIVKMVGITTTQLGVANVINSIPGALVFSVTVTYVTVATSRSMFGDTSFILMFFMIFLYYINVVAIAFASSYIMNSTDTGATTSLLIYVILYIPARITHTSGVHNDVYVYFCGFLPFKPLFWFWDEVCELQFFGKGLSLWTMWQRHTERSPAAFVAFLFMLGHISLYFGLSWYMDQVRPGKYGVARRWNYWHHKSMERKISTEEIDPNQPVNPFFEPEPQNATVGIKIDNVTKIYSGKNKNTALRHVSFNIYKNEITVLVGHNGAGKTTLMNIISGMTAPTSGSVLVNQVNIRSGQLEVQRDIGMCTQHNAFFANFNVLEHVMFFYMIKGETFDKAQFKASHLLNQLLLLEKGTAMPSALSGGMRRRLQLACALAGDTKLLILDEPTSGLDLSTRRELWDFLISLRGSRTILITTHFMEEADALGDRIAALNSGRLQAHGTPMFLKRTAGTGYRLSLTINEDADYIDIVLLVQSMIPRAELKSHNINTLIMNLPADDSERYPKLFNLLESKKQELGIETIGVGLTTLEEVFLKLCVRDVPRETKAQIATIKPQSLLTGYKLFLTSLSALLYRQYRYTVSRKMVFLIFQTLIPILLVLGMTMYIARTYSDQGGTPTTPISLNFDIFASLYKPNVYLTLPEENKDFYQFVASEVPNFNFKRTEDAAHDVLMAVRKGEYDTSRDLAGVKWNNTDAVIGYATVYRHVLPVALNLLSNALAQARQGGHTRDGETITTVNHPIASDAYDIVPDRVDPKPAYSCFVFILWVFYILNVTVLSEVVLFVRERESGARRQHLMAGAGFVLHSATTLVYKVFLYSVLLVLPVLLFSAVLEQDQTIDNWPFLSALGVLMIIGGFSNHTFVYFLCNFFGRRACEGILTFVLCMYGLVTPVVVDWFFHGSLSDSVWVWMVFLTGPLVPVHSLQLGGLRLIMAARREAGCQLNLHQCPSITFQDSRFDPVKCCAGYHENYYALKGGCGWDLIQLVLQIIVYFSLSIMVRNGMLSRIGIRIVNRFFYTPQPYYYDDRAVREEKRYVAETISQPVETIKDDNLLVHSIHKYFRPMIGKSCHAVKGISLSVKRGECFGLLGVNGAGKSTTFKVLTGERTATRGRLFANGVFIANDRTKYLRSIGYCPQHDCLDPFLTGTENLSLLLSLRGLDLKQRQTEIEYWLKSVDLTRYKDVQIGLYSGGCRRRLACVAALCTRAPLVLLDEPTAGVDTAARSLVHRALRNALHQRRSLLVTSHSMDEMEALCDRIGILSSGEMCALGSPASLRRDHAVGHALRLKLKSLSMAQATGNEPSEAEKAASSLKGAIHARFDCELTDEHLTMLLFHINETMPYSELFTELENLKKSFDYVIEDYVVNETTLEEVFLSFSKHSAQVQDVYV